MRDVEAIGERHRRARRSRRRRRRRFRRRRAPRRALPRASAPPRGSPRRRRRRRRNPSCRVTTMMSRPSSTRPIDSKVLRPMIERLAHGDGAEFLQVGLDPPGQAAVDADHAVLRDGRDEDDRRSRRFADDPTRVSALACQAIARPAARRRRAERAIEADRRLVPVEHRPVEAAQSLGNAALREAEQERLADARAAMLGRDEEILQIDAVAAAEGRIAVEPDRVADRLAVDLGDVAEGPWLGPKSVSPIRVSSFSTAVEELLVFGQRLDQPQDGRSILRLGLPDRRSSNRDLGLDVRMRVVASSSKSS